VLAVFQLPSPGLVTDCDFELNYGVLRTFKLIIAYDGTAYAGWQRQARVDTVQARLEAALTEIEGRNVTVHGAGRTDAGVHAWGQVASFELAHGIDICALGCALNAKLPDDVRVGKVETMPMSFHARFGARRKSYRYRINHTQVANPMERRFAWHVSDALDLEAMRQAGAILMGQHDFAAFQTAASDATVRTTVRTVFDLRIDSEAEAIVAIDVVGDGFLRYMVRTIVGTLVEVGLGRRSVGEMGDILTSRARNRAGPTAPPHGLFLVSVDYSGN
jgi:tRNA pseudouridine38-40 synthase